MLLKAYQKGFTLTELSITITIMAIIATMSVPYFLNIFKNMEAKSVASYLQMFLTTGKQTALIYHKSVVLCVANDNYQCVTHNGSNLLVFIDNNQNNKYDPNIDQLHEKQKLSLKFGKVITSVSLHRPYIELKPITGRPIGYMGHIKYCPNDRNKERMFKVSFSRTGIIKYKTNQQEATNC